MIMFFVVGRRKRYGAFKTREDAERFCDFLAVYNGATGLRIEVAHVTE